MKSIFIYVSNSRLCILYARVNKLQPRVLNNNSLNINVKVSIVFHAPILKVYLHYFETNKTVFRGRERGGVY